MCKRGEKFTGEKIEEDDMEGILVKRRRQISWIM